MEEINWVAVACTFALLAGLAYGINYGLKLEKPWLQPWSLARAIIQLGLLALVLRYLMTCVSYVVGFLIIMVFSAGFLVTKRLDWPIREALTSAIVLTIGTTIPLTIVFSTGEIPFESNYVLALGGSIIGGCMSISTLFCRTLRKNIIQDRPTIEAWLSLGATPRQAVRDSVRSAGSLALMPNTDQARMTGIVTLPGTFVGAVFGGLPVMQAAIFQVTVLASQLAAGAIAILCWTLILGAPKSIPTSNEEDN